MAGENKKISKTRELSSIKIEDDNGVNELDNKGHQWLVHAFIIMIFDAILIAFSYYFALLMRFDFTFSKIEIQYVDGFNVLIGPYILVAILIFWFFHLYHSIWRFASVSELGRMVEAWALDQVAVLIIYAITKIRMPIGFWIVGAMLGFFLTTALRFTLYFVRGIKGVFQQRAEHYDERVMIIGAGSAGRTLISELIMSTHLNLKVCCIIDDNPSKKGRYLAGIPIVGNRKTIVKNVAKYHITQIIYAIPYATPTTRKEILA